MKRCPQCGQTFDDAVQFCPTDGAKPVLQGGTDQGKDPFVGVVLGAKYRLEKKIGEGGMGKIYLSRHITLGKKYAVKMLNPEFSNNQEAIERFRREAVTAGELEHPNIINVTDIDYTKDGQAYIVMEFLDGCELRDILREEPVLPFQRLLRILYQVSRALDAAHSKGIIHRDLKPENIFIIDRADQKDVVKILDFGISKIKGGKGGTNLTQTGMVIGTPHYMAPEQARGDKDIDHRVDIYALGSIAYEMFTGKLPVNGDSPTAILMKILLEEPPFPETLNPNINPALSMTIRSAMAKDPNDRFMSCMQFVEALRNAAQIQTTAIRTSSFAAPVMQTQTPPPPGTPAPGMAPPTAGVPVVYSHATPPPGTGTTPMTWAGTGAMNEPQYQPKKKSSAVFIVLPLIVLFLAAGSVGAYFLMTNMDKTKGKELKPAVQLDKETDTKKAGDTAKETDKEKKNESISGKTPAKDDDKAIIKFNTTPKGATVMLKIGVVERQLCETTCEHEFNKSSKDVKLVFTKSGYQDEDIEISPDVPYKEILIKLTQKGKKKKSTKAKVQVVATTPEKKATPPAWVVTTPPPTETTTKPKDKKKAPVIRIIDSGEKKPDSKNPGKKKKPVIRLIPNK